MKIRILIYIFFVHSKRFLFTTRQRQTCIRKSHSKNGKPVVTFLTEGKQLRFHRKIKITESSSVITETCAID
ncbi:hypothetical protein LEP1GSC005_2784 [Leptospira santarosai str. ST188]|nr:hypothetical protein LEP1GSC005_2784 [Leptospira santarosai str. ST188]EMM88215.1 hypothetical protein LEP1GSC039_3325 [Leptospira santarosai str. 2000027870]